MFFVDKILSVQFSILIYIVVNIYDTLNGQMNVIEVFFLLF